MLTSLPSSHSSVETEKHPPHMVFVYIVQGKFWNFIPRKQGEILPCRKLWRGHQTLPQREDGNGLVFFILCFLWNHKNVEGIKLYLREVGNGLVSFILCFLWNRKNTQGAGSALLTQPLSMILLHNDTTCEETQVHVAWVCDQAETFLLHCWSLGRREVTNEPLWHSYGQLPSVQRLNQLGCLT